MNDLDHLPDLLHFPDNDPGAAARRKRMADTNRQGRLDAVSEDDFDRLSINQIAEKHDLPDLDEVEVARVINPLLDRAGERERREEQAEIRRKKTNPLKLAPGTNDPVRTQDFGREQATPFGGLPNPGTGLQAGTVETTPLPGKGANAPGRRPGGPSGSPAVTGTAALPPAAPSDPTPLPPGGFTASRVIEQGIQTIEALTGENRTTLGARGRQHLRQVREAVAATGDLNQARPPQTVGESNFELPEAGERLPQSIGQSNFPVPAPSFRNTQDEGFEASTRLRGGTTQTQVGRFVGEPDHIKKHRGVLLGRLDRLLDQGAISKAEHARLSARLAADLNPSDFDLRAYLTKPQNYRPGQGNGDTAGETRPPRNYNTMSQLERRAVLLDILQGEVNHQQNIVPIVQTVLAEIAQSKSTSEAVQAARRWPKGFKLPLLGPIHKAMIRRGLKFAAQNRAAAYDSFFSMTLGLATADVPDLMRQKELFFRDLTAKGRAKGAAFAADMMDRWIEGSGKPVWVDTNWLLGIQKVAEATDKNRSRVENWLLGQLQGSRAETISQRLQQLMPGQSFAAGTYWDSTIKFGFPGSISNDFALASNRSNIRSRGTFEFRRIGNRIVFSGNVSHVWREDFNWNKGVRTKIIVPANTGLWRVQEVNQDDGLLLDKFGSSRPFPIRGAWQHKVSGELSIGPGSLKFILGPTWKRLPSTPNPALSRHP